MVGCSILSPLQATELVWNVGERLVDLLESRLTSENGAPQDLSPQSSDRPASDMDLMNTPANSHPAYTPSSEGRNREAVGFANKSHSGTPDCSAEIGQTPMSCSGAFDHTPSWLSIPEPVAIELIHLFFEKIQPWLPLLHKPRFFASYLQSHVSSFCDPCSLVDHDKLLIYGMLALAARHSTNEYFANVPAPERGNGLLKEACTLYGQLREADELPNIKYLQGCVLLANGLALDGPCYRTWILTGVSVRMAYDLDLCNMDDVEDTCSDPEEWTAMEERRRLFWAIWEIDAFLSTIARRPRAIDHRRMAVLLPANLGTMSSMGAMNTFSSNHEMTLLMLGQFGSVWKLGSLLTDVANLLSHHDTLSEEEVVLAKRFLVFFPNLARRQRSLRQRTSQACGKATTSTEGGMSLEKPPEAIEPPQHFHEATGELANTHDFGPATLEDISNFQLDLLGDWSVGLPLDDVYNDNQNFNYLQL
ncbi:hypothetical protein FPANT_11860 [Fusarium pseudoanthophilum]|uniref:Xylanolytic transcriptional activator regulatory domain-containing protein n=1 Tax=Fusarium pseudoanthophilum TaxID=48495 RepID=A0A8H5KL95_9HYPO|nr:hypothetical protein FPANT_11860 [Fusarium pseudoanthophilum]